MSDSQDNGGQKKQPSFHAFQVDNGQDGNAYFNKIGAAFEHKDGQGHTVDLKSIPVDGRVVLRTPQERLQEMAERARPAAATGSAAPGSGSAEPTARAAEAARSGHGALSIGENEAGASATAFASAASGVEAPAAGRTGTGCGVARYRDQGRVGSVHRNTAHARAGNALDS